MDRNATTRSGNFARIIFTFVMFFCSRLPGQILLQLLAIVAPCKIAPVSGQEVTSRYKDLINVVDTQPRKDDDEKPVLVKRDTFHITKGIVQPLLRISLNVHRESNVW